MWVTWAAHQWRRSSSLTWYLEEMKIRSFCIKVVIWYLRNEWESDHMQNESQIGRRTKVRLGTGWKTDRGAIWKSRWVQDENQIWRGTEVRLGAVCKTSRTQSKSRNEWRGFRDLIWYLCDENRIGQRSSQTQRNESMIHTELTGLVLIGAWVGMDVPCGMYNVFQTINTPHLQRTPPPLWIPGPLPHTPTSY
jgi:hypothetical protein